MDQNNDGLISPGESYAPPAPQGAIGFRNREAKVINNQASVNSTIWINQDFTIDDIDVRVAITKQDGENLTLSLVGPDNQTVTLFEGKWSPWPGPDIFESTLIDDEAPLIKQTLPQAPLPRKLKTDGLKSGKPGLGRYEGKSSRGPWRLTVRNLSNRVGVLHSWSLWIKPRD